MNRTLSTVLWLSSAGVAATVTLAVVTGAGKQMKVADPTRPQYTADGKLKSPDPEVFRDWVQLGTPLTPNDLNNGEAAFPEFHAVYVPQWAWAEFKKTGTWPDGTILAKELELVGEKKAPSGNGYFEGEFHGLDIAVKDSKHSPETPNNWAYYNFNHAKPPYAVDAASQPKANCSSCHEANAGKEADYTFIKYYPKALAAQAKAKMKDKPKDDDKPAGK